MFVAHFLMQDNRSFIPLPTAMVTERDLRLLEHLQRVRAMTSRQASLILCPTASQREKIARRRLKALYDEGYIKRTRNHLGEHYVYYVGRKMKNWAHALKVTDFYIRYYPAIKRWILEPIIGPIRADALAEIQIHSKRFLVAYEAEIGGLANIEKYEKLFLSGLWKNVLPVFPIVVVGGKYKESKIIKVIGEDELYDELGWTG